MASATLGIFSRRSLTLADDRLWSAAVAGVVVLQAALILGHRPWLDEVQALQIATESPSLRALMGSLRYEGHPPLWYLLLRALAAIVPLGWVLQAAAGGIAAVTQGVILARAPFGRAERLMLASGELVMFEYLTLSRSLSLGVCCLILTMALRRGRWVWLPIALLPLCDFLFGILSLAMIAIQARDHRLWRPGLVLWALCALLAAWSVRPAPDVMPALEQHGLLSDFGDWISRLGVLLVPMQTVDGAIAWNGVPPFGMGVLLGPLFLWLGCRQTAGLDRLLFCGFAIALLAFSVLVYPLQTRHLSLLAFLLILLAWRQAEAGQAPGYMFRAWLAAGSLCGLAVAAINLVQPFDTAFLAARAIRERHLTDRFWISFPESRAQAVALLTGLDPVIPERGCTESFIHWSRRQSIETPPELERALRALTAQHGPAYLLSDLPIPSLHGLVRPLVQLPAGYDGQRYNLYAVDGAPGHHPVPFRPCVPHREHPPLV